MSNRLDLDSLRALKAVSDSGGVTRAADLLALSQSAVSHKIKRLEETIDCKLLNRKPGTPLLTDTGNRLLAYADRMLSLHDEALAALSRRKLVGNIRLGMTEDITGSRLARILSRFSNVFPDVTVTAHVAQSLILQEELSDETIDLAVMQVFSHDVLKSDLVLSESQLCWVKALDFPLDVSRPIPFLSYDDNCFYKNWMLDSCGQTGCRFRTVLKCTSNTGIVAAVEAGLGISIINNGHITPAMEIIEDHLPDPPGISYVLRSPPRNRSNAVEVLIQEIVREISDPAPKRAA